MRGPINFPAKGDSTREADLGRAIIMSKSAAGSTLYRLIEAGHLARQALLAPLVARGLEAGDDAVLLGLADPAGATTEALLAFTGMSAEQLDARLARLEDRDLLLRLAVGPEMEPGARLSQQGHAAREAIAEHWALLEETIAEDLGKKRHGHLRKGLRRIVEVLRG